MAEESYQDKTEQATPRKRSEARKKGQVASSREVPSVAVLIAALATLWFFGGYMYSHLRSLTRDAFAMIAKPEISLPQCVAFGSGVIERFVIVILPVMTAVVVTALVANVLQVGWLLSWEKLRPELSKIDPIKGMQRLISRQTLMELFKSLAKLGIVATIGYLTVKGEMDKLPFLADMEVQAILVYILKIGFKIFIRMSMAMILIAIADYAFQRWHFEQQMKMTKQEVRDEFKRTEGDPIVKARIKKIQYEMAKRRMMQEVPEADVVVTNPVHLAVALKYESSEMKAPKVLAKGAGDVAERIKAVAKQHDVPIVEDKDLARNLYKMVEIGSEIPSALYQSVAEVLAYVYRLRNRVA